jgi:beta-lactamase class A
MMAATMKSTLRKLALSSLLFVLTAAAPAQTAPPKSLDLLKHKLERISQGVSADWGIYIKSLDTGEEIAINADAVMDTMSVIKIPLLVDVYRQVDSGKLNPAERIKLTTADKRFGTGVLRTLDPGLDLSLHDALMLMIIHPRWRPCTRHPDYASTWPALHHRHRDFVRLVPLFGCRR